MYRMQINKVIKRQAKQEQNVAKTRSCVLPCIYELVCNLIGRDTRRISAHILYQKISMYLLFACRASCKNKIVAIKLQEFFDKKKVNFSFEKDQIQ